MVELRKRPATSDISVQELTEELKDAKSQLGKVFCERPELSTKLKGVEKGYEKRLETRAVLRGARDLFEALVRTIVGKSL